MRIAFPMANHHTACSNWNTQIKTMMKRMETAQGITVPSIRELFGGFKKPKGEKKERKKNTIYSENRLPKEVVNVLSPQVFKTRLDKTLSKLV